MREPTLNDRFLLLLAVFLFGLGIASVARGEYGISYFDFGVSGLCFAAYR